MTGMRRLLPVCFVLAKQTGGRGREMDSLLSKEYNRKQPFAAFIFMIIFMNTEFKADLPWDFLRR